MKKILALVSISCLSLQPLAAWGVRGHTVANLAAVEAIPQDGPAFLKPLEAYIGQALRRFLREEPSRKSGFWSLPGDNRTEPA